MEKIQYTQQEWGSIIDDLGWNPDVMEELKQKGYIRKSAVEEAEESCENSIKYLKDQSRDSAIDRSINDIEKYIQELRSEIARLKG